MSCADSLISLHFGPLFVVVPNLTTYLLRFNVPRMPPPPVVLMHAINVNAEPFGYDIFRSFLSS